MCQCQLMLMFVCVLQDSFLPHIEDGTIILIGATTENPSFQVNNALMSRCKVVTLEKLSTEDVMVILQRAANSLNISITDNSSGDVEKTMERSER